jgi:hypothetical protein
LIGPETGTPSILVFHCGSAAAEITDTTQKRDWLYLFKLSHDVAEIESAFFLER